MNKDLSSMSRDELEQNIIELTTQVESQKQKIQWLQEQFNLLQQKRFGASSEKDMADGDQMSLFNEAEWTVDEAEGEIAEPDMAKVAPPKKENKGREAAHGKRSSQRNDRFQTVRGRTDLPGMRRKADRSQKDHSKRADRNPCAGQSEGIHRRRICLQELSEKRDRKSDAHRKIPKASS